MNMTDQGTNNILRKKLVKEIREQRTSKKRLEAVPSLSKKIVESTSRQSKVRHIQDTVLRLHACNSSKIIILSTVLFDIFKNTMVSVIFQCHFMKILNLLDNFSLRVERYVI